jgi:hypothetical protein
MLPYRGAELLFLSCVFLCLCVFYAVTFLDIVVKQFWPSMLNPGVAARIAHLQQLFPNLGADPSDGERKRRVHTIPHPTDPAAVIKYDAVVAQAPYISSRSVDEDLVTILLNNDCFATVSCYCSNTVRGFAMLSVLMTCSSMVLSFMWMRNYLVDPSARGSLSQLSLFGYVCAFITGVVMQTPENANPTRATNRNANILCWFSVPLSAAQWINSMHMFGLGMALILPLGAHIYIAMTTPTMPYLYWFQTMFFSGLQVMFIVAYAITQVGLTGGLTSRGLNVLQSAKLSILVETLMVFTMFLGYLHWEGWAPSTCIVGGNSFFTWMLWLALVTPFAWVSRITPNAPSSKDLETTPPSLLLLFQGAAVATYGVCPTLEYAENDHAELPHILLP